MSNLVGFVNQGIHDLFICYGEDFCDGCNKFKDRLPDSFADGQFLTALIDLSEEFAYSLIVHETLHGREDVVLERHEGGACNLRSEYRLGVLRHH